MKMMLPSILVSLSLCWLALEVRGVKNALPSAAQDVVRGMNGVRVDAEIWGRVEVNNARAMTVKITE